MPHTYTAAVRWQRRPADTFAEKRYSRRHEIAFDGGVVLPASASPAHVPPPWADPSAVDPEEMFVAALASCHMLWFLSIAAAAGWPVERYADEASGTMAADEAGRSFVADVTLRPQVAFAGERAPGPAELHTLHERAHAECYIANSVKTKVLIVPRT